MTKRNALVTRIEQAIGKAPVWIEGPAGSGKSTLLTQTMARLDPSRCIWCPIASPYETAEGFLYQLIRASHQSPWHVPTIDLATLAPAEIQSRCTSWVRQFYERLPFGTVVVVDNLDWLTPSEAGALILGALLRQASPRVGLVVASRFAHPLCEVATGGIFHVGYRELRLAVDEAHRLSPMASESCLRRLDGLAGNHVLFRTLHHRGDRALVGAVSGNALLPDLICRLLSFEDSSSAATILTKWACVGSLRDLIHAEQHSAIEIATVAERWRDDGLVEPGEGGAFTILRSIREFLRDSWHARLDGPARDDLRLEVARAALRSGDVGAALGQLAGVGARMVEVGRLLEEAAVKGLAAEHHGPWLKVYRGLPNGMRKRCPGLLIAESSILQIQAPRLARSRLTHALAATRRSDPVAQLEVLSSMVDSYYFEWDNLTALRSLGRRMLKLYKAAGLADQSTSAASRIRIRLAVALLVSGQSKQDLFDCIQRILQAKQKSGRCAEQLLGAMVVLEYHIWHPGVLQQVQLLDWIVQTDWSEQVPPIIRVWWTFRAAAAMWGHRPAEEVQALIERARKLMHEFRLEHTARYLDHSEAEALLLSDRCDEARQLIDRMKASLRQYCQLDLVYCEVLEAIWNMRAQRFSQALEHALLADGEANRRGLPHMQRPHLDAVVAFACVGAHRFEDADHWWSRALHNSGEAPGCRAQRELTRVYALLLSNEATSALKLLRKTLGREAQRGATSFFKYLPGVAALLAEEALASEIEPQLVRQVIRRQALRAPDASSPFWPWPVSLYTMGDLQLRRDGLLAPALVQRKPAVLLVTLVAATTLETDRSTLAEALWKEAEVESPAKALEVALHRLRKWIGEDAIHAKGGLLTIDERRIWLDVGAITRLFEWCEQMPLEREPTHTLRRRARQLLLLHRGPFGVGIDNAIVCRLRDSLSTRLLYSALRLGGALMMHGELELAVALYQKLLAFRPKSREARAALLDALNAGAHLEPGAPTPQQTD